MNKVECVRWGGLGYRAFVWQLRTVRGKCCADRHARLFHTHARTPEVNALITARSPALTNQDCPRPIHALLLLLLLHGVREHSPDGKGGETRACTVAAT